MLRRSTKIQLILFVILTLVGVSYVSAEYVGLAKNVFSDGCTVSADFKDSGGIFTNAEVTYRGVTVGKVGEIHLRREGIRVDLDIEDCGDSHVPTSAAARVNNRSVVGEQYVDLIPPNGRGPFFKGGERIPQSRTSIPTPTNVLLTNLNRLVQSVPLDDLRTTVSELGKAFDGRGNDLARLLDSTSLLLDGAQRNLPDTIALINNSATVLQTQLDVAPSLQSYTKSLKLLSEQLKKSDPDIRRLLDTGPDDLTTVQKLIQDNRTDLGMLLANLATVGDLIVNHLDGTEQILELYPALAAGGQSAVRADSLSSGHNVGALGLVLTNANDPADCGAPRGGRQGYQGTKIRDPSQTGPIAPNVAARCTASAGSGVNVRGAQNVPGAPPISTAGSGTSYPRAITKDMVQVDTSLKHVNLGDAGWLAVLTASLR
ncbi:phospholipid/cholesterol/gamma-HCH transport system substrate-binding protein [Jatrophihabitans endophyticus]|uniref:Phospholipid/cholesterol/gamma-HCH transport system substrate-binding protein n=1 Tax=Jatrophihabitans endophyticus TaxID=1206085 RepID=A0A1M5GQ73_9ACTN|nr:MCE family protein [Jatrophihabitans endophyticus]SHG05808.1 phospholipid/cholesterol/gamma-HCH transport system substrate-binding protein [Jatrophihabitans endophyticus]